MKESHDVQTNDLIHLFSTTFKSLADDAECIREISTLAELMGVGPPSLPTSLSTMNDGEDYAQQLRQMDQIIRNMEEKVKALREIINEENRALIKFETTLKGEADTEARLIEEMMLVFQNKSIQDNNNNNNR